MNVLRITSLSLLTVLACDGTTEPAVGSIQVTTVTTGVDVDPDGYTVTVDGTTPRTIRRNGTTTFSGLATGGHSVQLKGMDYNCGVSGDNPRTVAVSGDGTAETTFSVDCAAWFGNIEVTTTTTGENIDPDGYTVSVIVPFSTFYMEKPIGVNAAVTFSGLKPDLHLVGLHGIATNCTVFDPGIVTVTSGGTARTSFNVTCAALTGQFLAYIER